GVGLRGVDQPLQPAAGLLLELVGALLRLFFGLERLLAQLLAGGTLQRRLQARLLTLLDLRRGAVHRLDRLVQDKFEDRGPLQPLLEARRLLAQALLGL